MKFVGLDLTLTDATVYPVTATPNATSWVIDSPAYGTSPIESDDNPFTLTLAPARYFQVQLKLKSTDEIVARVELTTTNTGIIIFRDIGQTVALLTPGYELDQDTFDALKRKWQAIVGPVAGVPIEDTYNELVYPHQANLLISYLIVRDLMMIAATSTALDASGGAGVSTKIVTGPTEVDFADPTTTLRTILGDGMPFEIFMSQLCGLASLYHIHFHGCDDSPTVISVMYSSDSSYEHKYLVTPEFQNKL